MLKFEKKVRRQKVNTASGCSRTEWMLMKVCWSGTKGHELRESCSSEVHDLHSFLLFYHPESQPLRNVAEAVWTSKDCNSFSLHIATLNICPLLNRFIRRELKNALRTGLREISYSEFLLKACWYIPNLVKIEKKKKTLSVESYARLWYLADTVLYNWERRRFLRDKTKCQRNICQSKRNSEV